MISNGQHPFGDVVKRHLNIISYEYDLRLFSNPDVLDSTGVLAEQLIKDMISKEAVQRPTIKAILTHPFFWNSEKILNFLQVRHSQPFIKPINKTSFFHFHFECRM